MQLEKRSGYFSYERSPTEYQGCFTGRPRTSRSFTAAAGVTMKHDGQEVKAIIAPERPSTTAKVASENYTTSYQRQFQKGDIPMSCLTADPGISAHSVTYKMTHNRCIAHEQPDAWRRDLTTEYASMLVEETERQKTLRKAAVQACRRPQEEAEDRWRRWQESKQKQENLATTTSNAGVSDAASVMPAGLRQAKCLHDVFMGGIRLPLLNEDHPNPQWTTLTKAPWVGRPKQAQPAKAKLPPWVEDDTIEIRPKHVQRAKAKLPPWVEDDSVEVREPYKIMPRTGVEASKPSTAR